MTRIQKVNNGRNENRKNRQCWSEKIRTPAIFLSVSILMMTEKTARKMSREKLAPE